MRYYSSTATPKTLAGAIANGTATSMTVNNVAGLPTLFPYTLVIDSDLATEEIVSVTAAAGNTLTIVRGQDGTTGTAHALGAAVRHMVTARDLQEPQNHIDTTVAHGATGAVVGTTNAQTLTNKTISGASNTLSNIAQSAITNLAADLAAKAPLASPALTGTPTATTAAADTNTTQIATTAFVIGQAGSTAPAANGVAAAGSSLKYSRADHVHPVSAGTTAYAYLNNSSAFNITTAATFIPVTFASEILDSANGHSTSVSTERYTATVAGYYAVSARGMYYNNSASGTEGAICIGKNAFGTLYSETQMSFGNVPLNQKCPLFTDAIVYLNGTTDYIAMYAYCSAGTSGQLLNASMTIQYIGA